MTMRTSQEERTLLKNLEEYDTPTVTNAVATYPTAPNCLGLYAPWEEKWYTDQRLKAMFPEMGPVCGYAVSCVYGLPGQPDEGDAELVDVLKAIKASPQPVILLIKQDFPVSLRDKVGLCGGNMATAFKALGCVGIVSDGPSRDLDEVRDLGLQYLLTGTTAGHGPIAVKAVNVPVEICGMEVKPGELVHMDKHGAVKFPREKLRDVLAMCRLIAAEEEKKKALMAASRDPASIAACIKGNYA